MTINEASVWATAHLGKHVTPSNISYLIQYGQVPKNKNGGGVFVRRADLENYYRARHGSAKTQWEKQLGGDLNWKLSFAEYKESETTKHVHRLHPYKGKFIPQMVEYFLGAHTDQFKPQTFFGRGDIIIDPFCGSGTTLVQANELHMHAVGVDVSSFNAFISNVKIDSYDLDAICEATDAISRALQSFRQTKRNLQFESRLSAELAEYNGKFFPSPEFKRRVRENKINEQKYGKEKAEAFLPTYQKLIAEYGIPLTQNRNDSFLDTWFLAAVRAEMDFVFEQVRAIESRKTKKIASLILSRTIRSCRATTHADLGTLREPILETYYCRKHGKICKPLFSILGWWRRYSQDTVKRLQQFAALKTDTYQRCLVGDSRTIDIIKSLKDAPLAKHIQADRIAGIFSSPPYVGLIDYHDQHAYAYDLFGFERHDALEIGPLCRGQGARARQSYVEGVSDVLCNCKLYLKPDYHVFLVANDKHNLYPTIAERSGMRIVNQYKRPVLNRVEKDRSAYAETIFHMTEK